MKFTEVVSKIKPEHADAYEHLNNSFHAQYFELGRVALQTSFGIDDATLSENGMGLWVQDTYIRRMKQVLGSPEIKIRSSFLGYHGMMVYMHHQMLLENDEIAFQISEHFFVKRGEKPTVTAIPSSLLNQLSPIEFKNTYLPGMVGVIEYLENKKRQERIKVLKEKKKWSTRQS